MKIHDVEQGSDEWWALRTGRPTCSNLPRILTEKRLEYSKGARAYASELIAERLLGEPLDRSGAGVWSDYGKAGEDYARKWYEFHRDVDVEQVGFITTSVPRVDKNDEPVFDENGLVVDLFGGSPDGLVGDDGLIEIKCRGAKAHSRIMTGAETEIANRLQTQGYLWLTGRKWIDVVAFNPDLPKKIKREYVDEHVHEMIEGQLQRFFREMALAERKLRDLGDVIEESEELKWDLSESIKGEAA